VNNSIAIFDSTNQQKFNQPIKINSQPSQIPSNSIQHKSQSHPAQQQTKGKQAYNLLKKYEKEDQVEPPVNTDYLKTTNEKEKSPSPPMQVRFLDQKKYLLNFDFAFIARSDRTNDSYYCMSSLLNFE
jgi:hypothetical protein